MRLRRNWGLHGCMCLFDCVIWFLCGLRTGWRRTRGLSPTSRQPKGIRRHPRQRHALFKKGWWQRDGSFSRCLKWLMGLIGLIARVECGGGECQEPRVGREFVSLIG